MDLGILQSFLFYKALGDILGIPYCPKNNLMGQKSGVISTFHKYVDALEQGL